MYDHALKQVPNLEVEEASSSGHFQVLQHGGIHSSVNVVRCESSKWDPAHIQSPAMQISGNTNHGLCDLSGHKIITTVKLHFPLLGQTHVPIDCHG